MKLEEIMHHYKEMTAKAKAHIRNGEDARGFAFGVAEFTAQMGGEHPEHMSEIVAEGKRRISEIAGFGAEWECRL